jgi:hypothetical protein
MRQRAWIIVASIAAVSPSERPAVLGSKEAMSAHRAHSPWTCDAACSSSSRLRATAPDWQKARYDDAKAENWLCHLVPCEAASESNHGPSAIWSPI